MTGRKKVEFPPIDKHKSSPFSYPHSAYEYDRHIPHGDKNCLLEWRVGVQESIICGVLEKLSIIKTDMIEHFKRTGTLENDVIHTKDYLINEIKNLLKSVEKTSFDVHRYEECIHEKWADIKEINANLKHLESHHLASTTELKSRLTRCDDLIVNTTQKISQLTQEIRSIADLCKRDISELTSDVRLHDHKLTELLSHMERSHEKFRHELTGTEENLRRQIEDVERRVEHKIHENEHDFDQVGRLYENERKKLEHSLMETMEIMVNNMEKRINASSNKEGIENNIHDMNARIRSNEDETSHFKQQVLKTFKEVESRMNKMTDDVFEQQRNSLDVIREEIHQGLYTMHETVTSVKAVFENKLRLAEENLHMELAQLRKLIILV